jgi:acyl carrier protein
MSDAKLKEIFSKTFEVPVSMIVDDFSYRSIALWDSIGHMALIAALDNEFDVMLDTQDILDMNSFQKSKEILIKHGVSFS